MKADIFQSVSQAEPEETPVEPPPIQGKDLPLNPAVLDQINPLKAMGRIRHLYIQTLTLCF